MSSSPGTSSAAVDSEGSGTCKSSTAHHQHVDCSIYECNICLGTAKYPVVCYCGHLFCWPCLYQWMHTSLNRRNVCPVCKFKMDRFDPVIPLHPRGSTIDDSVRISDTIPARPRRISRKLTFVYQLTDIFEWPEPPLLKFAVFSFALLIIYCFFA